jgi:hypothetical protein
MGKGQNRLDQGLGGLPMLAKTHFPLRFCFVLAACLSAKMPAGAQVQGVPSAASSSNAAKITAPAPEVRATQAAAGTKDYSKVLQPFLGNCCANVFLPHHPFPKNPKPPLAPGSHPHEDEIEVTTTGGMGGLLPMAVPVYIPYAIGYEPEQTDGDAPTAENYWYDPDSWDEADEATEEPLEAEPVVVQPATELVFKDGHHASVVNYAILGDALFDFDDGSTHKILLADLDLTATQKANDALGVEFKLPSAAAPATAVK